MKNLLLTFILISTHVSAQQSHYISEGQKFSFETVVKRSEVVWGMDFLPDKKIIFTERSGKMFVYDEAAKKAIEVTGLPKVYVAGQGGLLDVKVHPDFVKNNLIYFTYSEPVGELATTALGRAELKANKLVNFKKLFSAFKPNDNDIHFGSRIVLDGKGHVFFTVGDRYKRDQAQDLGLHMGKVIRLNEDGSVPKDNPFVGKAGALPEIWSYGHRNPQGLTKNPTNGEILEVEFGPQGGDEVNLIEPGKNYGWPVITYGREYEGPKIGAGITHKEGMEQPLAHWEPSISPSGVDVYYGEAFPAWKGDVFLANLSGQHLRRVTFKENKAVKQEVLLKDHGYRFRHVRTGPEGYLYVTTDEGIIGRIKPVISSH